MPLFFVITFYCQVFPDFWTYGVLPGRLTKADRELIVVATSIHNKCLYCVVSHSALHRIYSKKPTLADQVLYFVLFHLLRFTLAATDVELQTPVTSPILQPGHR